jgi:pyruvate/2-oxoglutarate dehydrogenase complex dihydrolipoamide dehydrogenase (E3) component
MVACFRYARSVCICTGARPKQLSGAENCGDRILTLRDVESVNSLEHKLKDARRVAIVGNGGIATELVYKLKGVQVSNSRKQKFVSL